MPLSKARWKKLRENKVLLASWTAAWRGSNDEYSDLINNNGLLYKSFWYWRKTIHHVNKSFCVQNNLGKTKVLTHQPFSQYIPPSVCPSVISRSDSWGHIYDKIKISLSKYKIKPRTSKIWASRFFQALFSLIELQHYCTLIDRKLHSFVMRL